MKQEIEDSLNNLKNLYSLSQAEKEESFGRIEAFMNAHPLPKKSPLKLEYFILRGFNYYTVAAVFFALTSLSLYAEGTIPGNYLYPVKVEVNDNIKILSSLTPESKAKTHIAIIKERIEDIDEAVEQGQIDAESLDYAATSIHEHTEEVSNIITSSQEEGDIATSLELSVDLEKNLDTALGEETVVDSINATTMAFSTSSDDVVNTRISTTGSSTLETSTSSEISSTFQILTENGEQIDTEDVEENLKSSKEKIKKFIEEQKMSLPDSDKDKEELNEDDPLQILN